MPEPAEIRLLDLDFGKLFTVEEFKSAVECGVFIDYDGSGLYATETQKSNLAARPSDFSKGMIRGDFTHVVWYNK